ncbi:hypothetical protein [Microbacterium terregens]|jgi:hypothetical protein|uniref:Uncharacterized protein n=1 Tax=Microbacterium terregens TaxID=69363 RepID=A0ABV5SYV5_9MICO
MLGRRTYTDDEVAAARSWFAAAVHAYRGLYADGSGRGADLEHRYAEALVLSLDRWFVHRLRAVEGNTTNPLTELGLLAESILAGGTLTAAKGIRYDPAHAVLGRALGAPVLISVTDAENLADAVFAELGRTFRG